MNDKYIYIYKSLRDYKLLISLIIAILFCAIGIWEINSSNKTVYFFIKNYFITITELYPKVIGCKIDLII
jgi:hypothetical protein